MNLRNEFTIVGAALSTIYNTDSKTIRSLAVIQQGYESLFEQVNSLEDIDDIAGSYRNLAERAIDELQAVEEEAAVNYDKAGELKKELEELREERQELAESMLNIIGIVRRVSGDAYRCINHKFIDRLEKLEKGGE